MATITITGIDEALARLGKMTAAMEPAFEKAAKAGGQLMAEKISAGAPRRTGGVAGSIQPGKVQHTVGDGFHSEVKPEGTDPHGEPYAKIVNILEYSATRGHPFFYATVDASGGEVRGMMADMVRRELTKE